MDGAPVDDAGPFFHGTRAPLSPGDLLEAGHSSNYGQRSTANFIYLTATMDAAIWGAELAVGEAPGRIFEVEPTGPIENDPNLTDQKFPGNPTRSFGLVSRFGCCAKWRGGKDTLPRCSSPCSTTWKT